MALPRVYRVVQDAAGNVVPSVLCSVLNEGTGVLATLWQNDAGTIPLSNPMTSDATYGSFGFYVLPGHYDLTFTKPGYTFQPQLDLQVPQDVASYGTMALQDANAVAITGGSATNLTQLSTVNASPGAFLWGLAVGSGLALTHPGHLRVLGAAEFEGVTGIASVNITHNKTTQYGLVMKAASSDTGNPPVLFNNVAGTAVGSISTTAAATAYNTTSDGRLKHDVETLTGELDVVRALRPVSFRWNVDDSPGIGFLAQEVAAHVPGVITGEADAVDAEGGIVPQMIDYAKLVPYLVGALQALAARIGVLEDALGV